MSNNFNSINTEAIEILFTFKTSQRDKQTDKDKGLD